MLVIAAHPDDETIGAGVLISRTPSVQIVHVTEGSPENPSDARARGFSDGEAYARARRTEAIKALRKAGVRENAIRNLRFVDQQVSFYLKELTFLILALIEETKPEMLLTHAFEGGHPDHDAAALTCHLAYELQRAHTFEPAFDLIEFTTYHAENARIRPYEFLPCGDRKQYRYRLTREERQLKIDMLREYETQSRTLAPFSLPQFETFRRAPKYDFSRGPHEGKLFYEYFDWGVDGQTWRRLASDVVTHLTPWRRAL